MSRRSLGGLSAAVLAAVLAAGFIPWRVTGCVQKLLDGSPRKAGWLFSLEQARWIPWRHLELSHLQVRIPGGGTLHLEKAKVFLRPASLLRGRVSTEWDLGEIRMDPGSWRIRSTRAQEILSTIPVTTQGSAVLHVHPQEIQFERFSLAGPVLQMNGQASFRNRDEGHLHLRGDLSRTILEAMQGVSEDKGMAPWQPFELEMDGSMNAPRIRFDSSFGSFVLNRPVEKKP